MDCNEESISINELLDTKQISVRSFNVCNFKGLISLKHILDFYLSGNSFSAIRNCGVASEKELIELCNSYKNEWAIQNVQPNTQIITSPALDNNEDSISIIELLNTKQISNWSYNVCKSQGLISLKHILDFYLSGKSFGAIKYCGASTEKELIELCNTYKNEWAIQSYPTSPLIMTNPVFENNQEDILLENISNLSVRSFNVCNSQGLISLKLILDFYFSGNSFGAIRNCGVSTEKELIELCNTYKVELAIQSQLPSPQIMPNPVLEYNEESISLDELFYLHILSVRSFNVCNSQGLITLKHILEYYFSGNSFREIRNCGVASEKELIVLCNTDKNKLATLIKSTIINKINNPVLDKLNSLKPFQKIILHKHFEYLRLNLSVRSSNGITKILDEGGNIDNFLNEIFSNNFSFKDIQNIGDKSLEELEMFRNELIKLIFILQTLESDELSKEATKLLLKTTFFDLYEELESKIEYILDRNGKIKLFAFLKLVIGRGQLFSKTESKLFPYLYENKNTDNVTLDSISKELNLSRERVRQVKVKLEQDIESYFLFVSNFGSDDLANYGIDGFKIFQVIDNSFAQKINKNEGTSFSSTFYSSILSVLLKKTHSLIGNNEVVFGEKKSLSKKKYHNGYLLHSLIFDCYDFEKFIEDVSLKLSERNPETYYLHFKGYLSNFMKNETKVPFDDIKRICETILFNEFDSVVNSDGYLEIERNTFKALHEYCYDILDEFSVQMTVGEIEKALNNKYPEVKCTSESIRGSLIREKEIFVCFGRTSTYALKKWETEKENLRGGTIRDIIEEYLLKEDEPKHISEILKYVSKFRNTNEKSIRANIMLDESKRFTAFKNSMLGLNSKNYSEEYLTTISDKITWNERFEQLRAFRETNKNRWPSILSPDKNERYLYSFLYKARKAFQDNKLDKQKEGLLRSIKFPIDENVARANDWNTEVKKLTAFLASKQRWPSSTSHNKEERALYRFCYLNKKAFHNKEMPEEKISTLIEINFNFNLSK